MVLRENGTGRINRFSWFFKVFSKFWYFALFGYREKKMNKILIFGFLVLIDTDSTVDLATNGAMLDSPID